MTARDPSPEKSWAVIDRPYNKRSTCRGGGGEWYHARILAGSAGATGYSAATGGCSPSTAWSRPSATRGISPTAAVSTAIGAATASSGRCALLKLGDELPVTVLFLFVVDHHTWPLGRGSNPYNSGKRSCLLLRLSGLSACRGSCSRIRRTRTVIRCCSASNTSTTGA